MTTACCLLADCAGRVLEPGVLAWVGFTVELSRG